MTATRTIYAAIASNDVSPAATVIAYYGNGSGQLEAAAAQPPRLIREHVAFFGNNPGDVFRFVAQVISQQQRPPKNSAVAPPNTRSRPSAF
jgi:hypothetical protein